MAQILFQFGVLARNHCEETSGLDLMAGYVGQTPAKVKRRQELNLYYIFNIFKQFSADIGFVFILKAYLIICNSGFL
jgi:hypothetical protein